MQKMSIDDLMTELDDARLTAKANGQASAMVAATMSKAKLLGLDKPVIKDVEPIANRPTVIRLVAGVSSEQAAQAYQDIMMS